MTGVKALLGALLLIFCLAANDRPGGEAYAIERAGVAVDLTHPFSGYGFTDAFPGSAFDQPVGMASPPGETNRLFVIERNGSVWVITNLSAPNKTLFLDLRTNTYSGYIEAGLLGIAFHPNYRTNRQFFLYRTVVGDRFTLRVSRFTANAIDPNHADPGETILIDQIDGNPNHNAGDLHFGPDGYLYISMGDESPILDDKRELPVAIDGGLFGGIMRIDVDQRPENPIPNSHPSVKGNYSIPADNPYVGATSFLGRPVDPARVRMEFYAVGMRNPWRFTFDGTTSDLIAGDVGSAWVEEINIVRKGGNYGWPWWEGIYPHDDPPIDFAHEDPLVSYLHGWGLMEGFSVIGGVVCRNASIPDLEGWYLFGDEGSGNVWRTFRDNSTNAQWVAKNTGISAFGIDPATRDVLTANIRSGQIRRLVYAPPEEKHVPLHLSEAGIFNDLAALATSAGLVPYEVNVPFWSDYAIKRRWFGLMNTDARMTFASTTNWQFPHGSVWVKHFDLEMERGNPATARHVETRLLVKSGEEFYGFTYRWADDGHDAELVPAVGAQQTFQIKDPDATIRTQVWTFPARGDCAACHSKVGGGALGFNTAQLNLDEVQGGVSGNQLDRLARAGYLQAESFNVRNLPRLAKSTETTEPLEYRVKSYLSANCSQCHQPGGVWGANWNARWDEPMAQANIINAIPSGPLTDDSRVVAPNSPTNSMMYLRITRNDIRMPPIASTVFDDAAGDLISEWIAGMPDTSFTDAEIGNGILNGSVTQRGQLRTVSGIGSGVSGSSGDRLHLLSGTLKESGHVVAHIAGVPLAQPGMHAGPMLRGSTSPDAPAAWLARDTTGKNVLMARGTAGAIGKTVAFGSEAGRPWLRLVRNGARVSAWDSADGVSWQAVGETDFPADMETLAGVAVASGEDWRFATVEFDQLETLSVSLALHDPNPNTPLPRNLELEASVETNGLAAKRVEFYADGQLVGVADAPPWRFDWTNAWAGQYQILATAVDQNGLSVSSQPSTVSFTADPPLARYVRSVGVDPNWQNTFGSLGQSIPALNSNLPPRTTFNILDADAQTYAGVGKLPTSTGALPQTAWVADEGMRIEYRPGNEVPHLLTLFFAQYQNADSVHISFFDPSNEALLDEQTVTAYADGLFVSWVIRGGVNIWIQSNSSLSATLNGMFIDPLDPPNIEILPGPDTIQLPASVSLQADASAQGRGIRRVEFWDGNVKLNEDTTPPFDFQWTGMLVGQHSITAIAVCDYGLSARSEPVTIDCKLPSASATFVGEDRTTQGDWIGPYGNIGQMLVIGWTNLPQSLSASVQANVYGFTVSDSDRRSLLRSLDNDSRFAGCYFVDPQFSMEMQITTRDGQPTRMSFYVLDWDRQARAEEVLLLDPIANVILDRRRVSSFSEGAYLVWNIQGDVRVVVRSLNDFNPIVNALFFDAPEKPASFWWGQQFPALPETHANWLEDPDGDGRPNFVECALGTSPFTPDPPLHLEASNDGQAVIVKIPAPTPTSDELLKLETSTDLSQWVPLAAERDDEPGYACFKTQADSMAGHFYRLRIEAP